MTDAEINIVDKLAAMCRARGVRVVDIPNSIRLELEPAQLDISPMKPAAEPDLCKCGHALYEHNNGLCLRNCEPTACLGVDEAQKLGETP